MAVAQPTPPPPLILLSLARLPEAAALADPAAAAVADGESFLELLRPLELPLELLLLADLRAELEAVLAAPGPAPVAAAAEPPLVLLS